MIETYLLQYLEAISKFGTLSEASKNLYVSQPTLSLSMKKLEEIIGVELFTRKKNSIALNDNGKFAADYAEKLLQQNKNFIESVREFDRKNRTISIGSCAPIPMNELFWILTEKFTGIAISSELNNDNYLLQGLKKDILQLAIFHEKPTDKDLFAKKFGSEKLFLVLSPNHPLAKSDGVFLEELNGQSVLLYSKIGFWYELCKKKAPNAKFLMQSERDTFKEIANSLAFPSFTTDFFIKNGTAQKNCVYKPVLDSEATAIYYCACKKNKKLFFQKVFAEMGSINFRHSLKFT